MANNTNQGHPFSLPIAAMMVIGVLSSIIVAASFELVKHWPLPISIAPYFGWKPAAAWGLVVGAISGLVLGFLTDDKHFSDSK